MRWLLVLVLAMALGGHQSQAVSAPKTKPAATDVDTGACVIVWPGVYANADVIAVAKEAGFNYVAVLRRCAKRDKKALHNLFWLTKHAGFDGVSSEDNSGFLALLMCRLGDDFFGQCLSREPRDVREEVRGQVIYNFGYDPGNGVDNLYLLKEHFPKSFPPGFKW